MTILFLILIIIASVVLGLIVLVQNPKGGGMAGSLAGISNQFMGVKQTTDVLEKGTWIFAAVIAILSITSSFFIPGGTNTMNNRTESGTMPGTQQQPVTPANPGPLQTTPPANQP